MSIKIAGVNTKVELDPYHADTCGASYTEMHIYPEARAVRICQEYDDNLTPMEIWHGVILARVINGWPVEEEARGLLESDAGQALLTRICNGHEVEWDGRNHVGRLTEDADEAIRDLTERLDSLPPSNWSLWDTSDYLHAVEYLVLPGMSDAALEALASELERSAEHEHVVLSRNVLEWAMDIRRQATEEDKE